MCDVDVTGRGRPRAAAVVFPGKIWGQLLQLRRVHHVILRGRVTQFDRCARILCEPRLKRENSLRVFCRLLGCVPDQLEHVRHVLHKIFAQLHGFFVSLRVVVAVRQAETALPGKRHYHRAVLQIRQRAEAEKRGYTVTMHVGDLRLHVFHALDFVYAGKFGHERLHPLRFAFGFVQTTGVEVADLLFVTTLDGVSFPGRLFQNIVQRLAIILGEDVEAAP